MEIKLSSGIQMPPSLPGAKGGDFPQPKPAAVEPAPATGGGRDLQAAVEQKRYEQVAKAAEAYFKDLYAVSDTRFTIYKDATGQYITRYTSLRDGKVTYIPEPSLLQYMERNRSSRESLIEIQA